ncbi:DUF4878 domain-containing protein [archaeon]|nr:MAG: DUF4878 domain-containing protein [archaeon]
MKKALIISLLIASLLCAGCIGGSEEDNAKDVVRSYYNAYNNHDAETIVTLFSDDMVESSGGPEKLKSSLEQVFTSAEETNLSLKIIRFINVRILDDTAYVNLDVELKDDEREQMSNLTFKLKKNDKGTWKIDKITEE